MLVGIRPHDAAFEEVNGLNFTPQNDSGGGNVAYYDATAVGDFVDFDLSDRIAGLSTPVVVIHVAWGDSDFELIDRADGNAVVAEFSGFDTDLWLVDLSAGSGRLRYRVADNDPGVDGTQSALLPYVEVYDAQV